jgi:DNA-binding NarL/FixJ family response regulator
MTAPVHDAPPDSLEPPKLSPQQEKVLRLIAAGNTETEVARLMYVSTNTVKTHVRGLLRALKARNRTQAVYIACCIGILTIDSPRRQQP